MWDGYLLMESSRAKRAIDRRANKRYYWPLTIIRKFTFKREGYQQGLRSSDNRYLARAVELLPATFDKEARRTNPET